MTFHKTGMNNMAAALCRGSEGFRGRLCCKSVRGPHDALQARQLGISRAELNKRLLAANIPTFEGEVDLEKVKCIAPSLNLGDPTVERIQYLRENISKTFRGDEAVIKRDDLHKEVQRLSSELMVESHTCQRYQDILENMARRLGELQISEQGDRRDVAFELCEWLRGEIVRD